jgi:hypothetical protein
LSQFIEPTQCNDVFRVGMPEVGLNHEIGTTGEWRRPCSH